MDFRKVFDERVAPEAFDELRPRYCDALFRDVIAYGQLDEHKSALEIGPGTGQATQPVLDTCCDYWAIELGEHFAQAMKEKFGSYPNFQIVNGDFETYDLGANRFDLVYSAATIQWIPEEIAFPKAYRLLKSGGALAMFMTHTDYRTANEALYQKIQEVYSRYFQPEIAYNQRFCYENAANYGFVGLERREYQEIKEYTADEYISRIAIHASHLTLQEPHRSKFFDGVKNAILDCGGKITVYDTMVLYLARKP